MSTVLLTGGAGGLGRSITQQLLKSGHTVIATLEPGGHTLDAQSNLVTHELDLTDEAGCRALVQKVVAEHGGIDATILLVGGFAMGSITDTDFAAIDHLFRLNFQTTYQVARPVFEQMSQQAQGGRFVLIGARPALVPSAGKSMVAYALSKSLVIQLSEILNAAGKDKNIISTVLVPSTIDTPTNRKAMPDADPANWVKPEDIAELIDFVTFGAGQMLRESVLKVYNKA
ncbi:SDR family NAD(P)-dependent oxidoreductase [Larkinella humicola]|uniref:SDR family NAD(P)-dependent oxidoreductase n=1 Tax=Larkinella humicola TaxID=2607654 RepID=A0A5N1JDF9_9BACT|nr:SDR family NAD(P)-dependent oxidoreductase [Larkinella humicola]KAA9347183.1 SDR family NAD(P)-dependent oxidoreductase [Larkinella humicola]